jgi:hypothetical protein
MMSMYRIMRMILQLQYHYATRIAIYLLVMSSSQTSHPLFTFPLVGLVEHLFYPDID